MEMDLSYVVSEDEYGMRMYRVVWSPHKECPTRRVQACRHKCVRRVQLDEINQVRVLTLGLGTSLGLWLRFCRGLCNYEGPRLPDEPYRLFRCGFAGLNPHKSLRTVNRVWMHDFGTRPCSHTVGGLVSQQHLLLPVCHYLQIEVVCGPICSCPAPVSQAGALGIAWRHKVAVPLKR